MQVHQRLGCGFLEDVYQEAFERELIAQGIPYEREKMLQVFYRDLPLEKYYKVDFVCFNEIVVELKALDQLTGVQEAQVINYLKCAGFHLGLLINFGETSLKYRRLVR